MYACFLYFLLSHLVMLRFNFLFLTQICRDLLVAYTSAVTGAVGVAVGLKNYLAKVIILSTIPLFRLRTLDFPHFMFAEMYDFIE